MRIIDIVVIVVYFVFILGFGSFFSRYATTTKDFFFAGQRFSWWMIALSSSSLVVGSYSFVKYSQVAYEYGFSSTQAYLNDWILLPLWLFGWYPIIWYSRVKSIPEYIQRRFGETARTVMTVLLLAYMVGYVGINFYTLGVALNAMVPWSVFNWALVTAVITSAYVSFGGQPSVIMTDLLQSVLLLLAGFLLIGLGLWALGGFTPFWASLPASHIAAMSPLTEPADFSGVGIFWQDGIANTAALYFLNQGLIMRFLAVRSERDGRRAVVVLVLVLMPLTAIAVTGAGWIGTALVHQGILAPMEPRDVFIVVTRFLCGPGVMGFVVAGLLAALMSTVDALINAISAVFVYDLYKPYVKKEATDRHYLRVAQIVCAASGVVGIALVPVYMSFKSIYSAHAAFTAAITPPLVTVILLGFLWRRFTSRGALACMIGGTVAIAASFVWPGLIAPFAHGVEAGGTGVHAWTFMRALYGMIASLGFGVIVSLFDRKAPVRDLAGLVVGPRLDFLRRFKGGEPKMTPGRRLPLRLVVVPEPGYVRVSAADAARLDADPGDLVYISDPRAWLGGLRSVNATLRAVDGPEGVLELGEDLALQANLDRGRDPVIERTM